MTPPASSGSRAKVRSPAPGTSSSVGETPGGRESGGVGRIHWKVAKASPPGKGRKGNGPHRGLGKKKLHSLLLLLLSGAIFFFQLSFLCCSLLPLLHSRGWKTNLVGGGVGG